MLTPSDLARELKGAVGHFWKTRSSQGVRQGGRTGARDTGARSMVTGGKQMDGFIQLFARITRAEGIPSEAIQVRDKTLPGYFRPEKDWDLVIVLDGRLIASVEFKSHVGSFGNNFNNRVEEALGNATDLNTAYREGAFRPSTKPWLGYMMLLEEHPKSTRPVKLREPHFSAFPEFHDASYQRRYELLCTRLVRERLYDAACLIVSPAERGTEWQYKEPLEELAFRNFVASLQGRLTEARRRLPP